MSSEEPEFDKWLKLKREKYEAQSKYPTDGFKDLEAEVPKVDVEWDESSSTKEYELMNQRQKRELVFGFDTFKHITKRITYRGSIFQARRAWARFAVAKGGIMDQVELATSKTVLEEAQ